MMIILSALDSPLADISINLTSLADDIAHIVKSLKEVHLDVNEGFEAVQNSIQIGFTVCDFDL